jgi:hypothetical protein
MGGIPDVDNALASQTISGTTWDESIGKLLTVDLHAQLKPQTMYAVVFSSAADDDNYRTLAASATDTSALTSSYGPGRIIVVHNGNWVTAENRKQNLFFVTLAD